ncbi:MAG: hypothetical protein LBJ13_01480 [Puniceicoccales bacterium]|jgi:hypothetical protein|nr:hypothetical protein [Puniceicoccales bacterium]
MNDNNQDLKKYKEECKKFHVDPNDYLKKNIFNYGKNGAKVDEESVKMLSELIKTESNKAFRNSCIRLLETLADDGNEFAIEAMYDFGFWKKPESSVDEKTEPEVSKEESTEKQGEEYDSYVRERAETTHYVTMDRKPIGGAEVKSYNGGYIVHEETEGRGSSRRGWKLHISATPASALKVVQLVLPLCEANKIKYKFIPNTEFMRYQNDSRWRTDSLLSQRGKYIVIYPDNDAISAEIARAINDAFVKAKLTRKDFFYVHGNFRVGGSGGVYSRLCEYGGADGPDRGVANILQRTLEEKCRIEGKEASELEHPFGQIGLWHRLEDISNKTVREIMDLVKKDYNIELAY